MSYQLLLVIILALIFEFLNGVRDSSNIVATMISSRAFRPRVALSLTAAAEFAAPFLFGTGVARTISGSIVDAKVITLDILIACLVGAISWNLITWFFSIPGSSTHAFVGGLLGPTLLAASWGAINLRGLYKVLIALFSSPVIGFVVGYVALRIIYYFARHASPNINDSFKRWQLFTALSLAFSYGTNDAQKTIGIIALSLIIGGVLAPFTIPVWVVLLSISATATGTLFGGWRLIRTLGGKFYKIRPVHSFATQLTSALVILGASSAGAPISSTQIVSSAIIGVGSSERFGKVRWGVAGDILTTWLITIPASGLFSAGVYWLIIRFF